MNFKKAKKILSSFAFFGLVLQSVYLLLNYQKMSLVEIGIGLLVVGIASSVFVLAYKE